MVPVRLVWPLVKLALLAWPFVLLWNLVVLGTPLDRGTVLAAAVVIPAWLVLVPLVFVRWRLRRDPGNWLGGSPDLRDAAENVWDRFLDSRDARRGRRLPSKGRVRP